MKETCPVISIVCPVYNEAEAIPHFFGRLIPLLDQNKDSYEVLMIDDGSKDATPSVLLHYQSVHPCIRIICLSRNFGKEAALTCGLDHANGDAVIPIDVDLQDPPELILEMLAIWRQGFEVVLAQRTDRSTDTLLKRKFADWFYSFHNWVSEVKIPPNVGDFRLLDRQVVDALRSLPERRRFMKGLFQWVGFRQAILPYTRGQRVAGTGKFTGWKLWNFAIEGLTSFSTTPLRIWTYLGLFVASSSFIFGLFVILRTIVIGRDLPGYASLVTIILFLGGIQLIGLGILGEYIGRIFSETKRRPVYIVKAISDDAE